MSLFPTDAAEPTAAAPAAAAPAADAKPVTKKFRNRHTTPRLPPDWSARQGRITGIAWSKLGGTEAAVAFLNAHDEALGGRPIDIAGASDAGYDAVAQALAAHVGAR